jgi:hypothetical protein
MNKGRFDVDLVMRPKVVGCVFISCLLLSVSPASSDESVADEPVESAAQMSKKMHVLRSERDRLREQVTQLREALSLCSTSYATPSGVATEEEGEEDELDSSAADAWTEPQPRSVAPPPPPSPSHHHPPHHPPHPRQPPPLVPPAKLSAADLASIEKHGSPCPVDWGSRRDGTRLRSFSDTTLAACCAHCRGLGNCNAFK